MPVGRQNQYTVQFLIGSYKLENTFGTFALLNLSQAVLSKKLLLKKITSLM